MSFLQKLISKGVNPGKLTAQAGAGECSVAGNIAQLDVDVYQTEKEVVIYAQAGGVSLSDVDVSVEGEADIVLIEGKRTRPEHIVFAEEKPEGTYFATECVWGDFYRRIILPESVDITKAEAKIKNGVLALVLPLMSSSEKEKLKLRLKREGRSTRR